MDKIDKWLEKRGDDIKDGWLVATQERTKLCESPIEKLFYIECLYQTENWSDYASIFIMPQYKIANYRVDFMFYISFDKTLPRNYKENDKSRSVIVELDSYLWHGSYPEQFAKEKERERFLQREGWNILRYSGKEIYRDVEKCVDEVLDYILGIETTILEKELDEIEKNEKDN